MITDHAPPVAACAIVSAALSNGMRIIVRENPAAPVVAMTLFVHVGSGHETAETNGVAALLGRAALKGTSSRSALEVAQIAEDAGGALEHATDQEYSELRARGLARYWRALLGVLHAVATAPGLAPDEVERERAALSAQIRAREDQPSGAANRLLSRILYGTHPYGLPTTGDLASVGRLTRAELARHFEWYYTPDRMILAISGQVSGLEVVAEAARLWSPLRRGAPAAPLPPPPERPAAPSGTERRSTQQAQLLVGVLAPPVGHRDHAPLKVLSAVLGGGMSSRLFRALRDEAGLAYAVGSSYPTRMVTSRIVAHVGTAPANLPAAEGGIRREMERLRAEPVPEAELARAKAFLAGTFALDLRTNARQAFYLGFFELMGVGHAHVSRHRDLIEAVTGADVGRVARRHLVEPSVVIVGPG